MAQLLIELLSEEIPSGMQKDGARYLCETVCSQLASFSLSPKNSKFFYGSRRLTMVVDILSTSPDINQERRGPKVGCPQNALDGFIKSSGINKEDLEQRQTPKGQFYFANISKKGQKSSAIIAEFIPDILSNFKWKKSMRWGDGSFYWVRPLHNITCILSNNDKTEIIPFEVNGINSDNKTKGHHFAGNDIIEVDNFTDYKRKLKEAYVIIDPEERKSIILKDIDEICNNNDLELIQDNSLIDEVSGLVEYPVVILGEVDQKFQNLPPEVLKTSMREHQKFFSLKQKNSNKITNFITISNQVNSNNNSLILQGNQKVLSARLSDAEYFYNEDLKISLNDHIEKLKNVTFYIGLGSQYDRALRLRSLCNDIAELIGANKQDASDAGYLSKADLVTQMVYEFPELQGIMGYYYASKEYNDNISKSIKDHYKPVGISDDVPLCPVTISVAFADKIDQLTAFWSINKIPTGSKDPFALRRAAIGIIRLLIDNNISISLDKLLSLSEWSFDKDNLKDFILERFIIFLKSKNIDPKIVQSLIVNNDITTIYNRANILSDFLKLEEGSEILSLYKRAANLMPNDFKYSNVNIDLLSEKPEKDLYEVIISQKDKITTKDYRESLEIFAQFKKPLFSFMDGVIINCDNEEIKNNRLSLLSYVKNIADQLADFSKL